MCEDIAISNREQEHIKVFDARFSRCRGLLHFMACRVLGSNEGAEDAVKGCWRRASRNPPKFAYEGAFRSWLLRILIDEALALLRKKKVSTSDGNPIDRQNDDRRDSLLLSVSEGSKTLIISKLTQP